MSEAIVVADQRTTIGSYADQKWELANPIVNEAFMAVAGRNRTISPEALGNYLRKSADRVVKLDDGSLVRFEKQGTRQGAVVWALVNIH